MTRIAHPPRWRTARDGALVHILAARPPLPFAWSAPEAEAALAEAKEFWHEAPEVTPESQTLALSHGIDPARPLDGWLSPDLRARLGKVVADLGMPPALVAGMRPWLASQMLRMAADNRRGLSRATAPEDVFRTRAREAGIPIRSEFPTPAALLEYFGGLPPRAEVEFLALELDEIEASAEDETKRALAWLEGDLAVEERHAARIERSYPAFYEHLAVERNAAWIPRIEEMLRSRARAFIVVGVGHMVGAGSLVTQARDAGIRLERN
jgi:uncharacterized protein YbaP (TraB family)